MEDIPEPQLYPSTPYDFTDPNIEVVYASVSAAIVGNTDISLYFGTEALTTEGSKSSLSHRIVITHHQFLRMMEYWATRYDVIQTMFEDTPMSFRQVEERDPERFAAAWAKINQPPKAQSEEDADKLDHAT